MKKILFTSTFVFLLCFTMINTIMAQSPELIKYLAVLRDASGNVVASTAKTVVVDILQGSSSGTSVYQETHSVTTTAQGVINLNIGGGTVNSGTFSSINWSTNSYWAKLTVDAFEITNGQLLSVPYSMSVKGITRDPSTGYLGVGVTSPASLLDIYGTGSRENITLKSNAADFGPEFRLISTAASGHEWRLVSGASASNSFGAGSFELWDQTAGASRFGITSGGRVGIGTTSPTEKLEINGNLKLLLGGALTLQKTAGGGTPSTITNGADDMYFNVNGGTKMFIKNDGYVGIGTTTPAYKLQVLGEINAAVDGGSCFRVGNDATINDINYGNGMGIYGAFDATIGHLKLGSAGPVMTGYSSCLGIGTTTPGYLLDVNGTGMFRGILSINTGSNDAILRMGPGNKAAIGYAQNWDVNNLYINGWNDWNGTYVNGAELYLDCRTWIYNSEDLVFKGYGNNGDYWFDNYDDGGSADFRLSYGADLKAYLNNALNGWQTPSDKRLKDNIKTLSVLEKIDMVRGASYTLKSSGVTQIGVIAQEMQAAFPAVVTGNELNGMLGVDYNAVAAIALQGVKELKDKLEKLEKENATLKAQVGEYNTLKAEVETLKNLIGGDKLGSR